MRPGQSITPSRAFSRPDKFSLSCIDTFSSGAPCSSGGSPTYTSAATEVPTPEVTTEAPTSEPTTVAPTTKPTPAVPVPITPYSNCTTESTEVSTGKCPAPQDGLQFGSFCDLPPTGVYGCKRPYTVDNVPTTVTYEAPLDCSNNPAGDTPVSIVRANQDFCAPEPDSECMVIDTGVYGCVFMAST
ncbi:hypothetical protein PC128_g24767 [Phytophthora cactorum]|nr:hypothetical protein PC128_g24767 [Phytophthora cactorum]